MVAAFWGVPDFTFAVLLAVGFGVGFGVAVRVTVRAVGSLREKAVVVGVDPITEAITEYEPGPTQALVAPQLPFDWCPSQLNDTVIGAALRSVRAPVGTTLGQSWLVHSEVPLDSTLMATFDPDMVKVQAVCVVASARSISIGWPAMPLAMLGVT